MPIVLSSSIWDLVDEASLQLGARLDRTPSGRTVIHAGCNFDISSIGIAPQDSLLLRVDLGDFDPQRDAQSVLIGMLLNTNLFRIVELPSWYGADHERAKLCVHFACPTHGSTPADLAQTIERLAATFREIDLTDTNPTEPSATRAA
jgi:Tir chaperone protein (CesT) family